VEAHRANVGEARVGAERRMEEMPARAMLFAKSNSPADKLLEAGRGHQVVHYDATTALLRHLELVRSGAPLPSWAGTAVAAATATAGVGVGVTAPAVLSAIVALSTAGLVAAWRHAEKKHATELFPTSLALVSTGDEPATNVAASLPEQGSSWASVALARMIPRPVHAEPERSAIAPALHAAKGAPGEQAGAALEAPSPARFASPSLALTRPPPETPAGDPSPAPPARSQSQHADDPRGSDEMKEVQEVASAERLLQSSPSGALSLVRSGEARFATGYLREERRYIGVIALFKLGRVDEARVEAVRFLSDYPDSPFSVRVRSALLRTSRKG
jgi:hypothetical protein